MLINLILQNKRKQQQIWIEDLALSIISHKTIGKSLHLSVLHFLFVKSEIRSNLILSVKVLWETEDVWVV